MAAILFFQKNDYLVTYPRIWLFNPEKYDTFAA